MENYKFSILSIAFVNILLLAHTNGEVIERVMSLGDKVSVSWTADFEAEKVKFTVIGQTMGFIGFGLSPQGGMNNADVVIGGVFENGTNYFSDRWATAKQEPKIDESQDWTLLSASENETHTILQIERPFHTCDLTEDLPINNDTTKFIWSLGATDNITYHAERGTASVNILDPYISAVDTSTFEIWDISVNTTIPTYGDPPDTTYWCTGHKSDEFDEKRHVVGFKVKLDSDLAIQHNHHMILHKCHAKEGTPEGDLLEEFMLTEGAECYEDDNQEVMDLCQSYLYVWAKGGDPLFLPQDVGFPINEEGPEYFLLEIHYDNPKVVDGIQYDTGIEVYTTNKLRKTEAGLLVSGHDVNFDMMIPPMATDYVISGHCSPHCTQQHFPPDGINVFNVLLHSHLSGRKLKLRHFRPIDGQFVELPWISYDNNYDFNYQQNRPLREHLKLLPGDQLTYECTYDTTWRVPPSATLGGLSTMHEMCKTYMMYYPRMQKLERCISSINLQIYDVLGIQEFDLVNSNINNPTILKPELYAGLNVTTVLDTMISWTDELRSNIQKVAQYANHVEICISFSESVARWQKFPINVHVATTREEETPTVTYPEKYTPYFPPEIDCTSGAISLMASFSLALFLLNLITLF